MAWVKLDDDFYQHPKVVRVGPLGLAMQVAALCYSNHNDTRGVLPYEIVPRLLCLDGMGLSQKTGPDRLFSVGHDPVAEEIAGWLVDAGIWIDRGDSYLIHDYDHYQLPDAELSAKRSEAGKRGAERRWGKGDSNGHELANGKSKALANPVPVPDPIAKDAAAATRTRENDPAVASVFGAYENYAGLASGTVTKSILAELDDGTNPDWIVAACEKASVQGGHSWSYVATILKDWKERGFDAPKRGGSNGCGSRKSTAAPREKDWD